VEVGVVIPHARDEPNARVTATGFEPNLVHLGAATLDWTASPKFDLGYRFGDGLGEVILAYRFLISNGDRTLPEWDLDGSDAPLHTRLVMNVVDLDYVSRESELAELLDLRWRLGVRFASIFFDSHAEGVFLEQQASNDFFGVGPHFGLDLARRLGNSNLAVIGRVDTSIPIGRTHQSFSEVIVMPTGDLVGGATDVNQNQVLPTLGLQLGMSWSPCWNGHLWRFSFGYEFEKWWYTGDPGTSRATLTTQGIFLRGEVNL
jgi:hypothetical protein